MNNKSHAMKEAAKHTRTPKVRFPEFRDAEGWKETELLKIARPVSERATNGDGDKVLSLSGEHGIVLQSDYFGKKVAGDNAERYIKIARNDFVYNDRTTKQSIYGTIKRLSKYEGGIVSPIYKCFRFNSEENPVFWDWYFESGVHESELGGLVNEGARAGRFNISIDTFLSTNVWHASIPEQQKIAECLTSLDELIAAHGQKLGALKDHKNGLMQQLFPRAGETRPRLRFPEFRDAPEWAPHKFGNFVVQSFYGTSEPTSDKGQYPVLRMGNMVDGGLDFTNLVYIDLDREKFDAIRLKKGDILLNRTNSRELVGKISLFEMESECITASYIVAFRLNTNEVHPSFCNLMLNTQLYQAKIKLLATPSISQANINPTTFRNSLDILIPTKSEQQRIAKCISSLGEMIFAQTQKVEVLKSHKKGLMQQLFPSAEEVEA
jgi:type I restriction enzyme S subunit